MSSKEGGGDMRAESKAALVPKLRFREFRGGSEWTDTSIDSILKTRDERRLPSALAPLFSLTIESGITEKTDRYNREFLVRDAGNKKYKLVEPDDIVYNPANLRWGAINYSQLAHSVVVSPIYEVLCLKDRSDYLLEFITYAIMRDEQIKRFIKKAQGTLVERIAVKIGDFLSTKMPVPRAVFEQQKIAECLSSLDDAIAAQARKVDALKKHKKGLMQQLFPREGETQPRLRFPEFRDAGEWSDDLLGNVCAILNNRRRPITSSDRRPGPYRYYGASGIVDYIDDFIFDERVVLVGEDGAKWGAFERTAFIVEGRFWVNNHAHVLKPFGVNDKLLEVYLTMADLSQYVTGAAPPKLTLGKLKEIPVPIPPDENEAKAIAECLSGLDALVAAETQNLEALKHHKRGLMQQLFPLSGGAES